MSTPLTYTPPTPYQVPLAPNVNDTVSPMPNQMPNANGQPIKPIVPTLVSGNTSSQVPNANGQMIQPIGPAPASNSVLGQLLAQRLNARK